MYKFTDYFYYLYFRMHLTITSLEWMIWDEEIKQLTIDTMSGQITLLPGHDDLLSVLKPWMVKILPMGHTTKRLFPFIVDKQYIIFWVMGGILQVEWNRIHVLTHMVIADTIDPKDILLASKQTLIDTMHQAKQSSQGTWESFDQQERESQIQKIDLELKIAGYKEIIR